MDKIDFVVFVLFLIQNYRSAQGNIYSLVYELNVNVSFSGVQENPKVKLKDIYLLPRERPTIFIIT